MPPTKLPLPPPSAAGGGALAGRTIGSLSPSRANDFQNCPLRYRFRVVDRLPEAPSREAARGTVVHAVLERLFDAPPAGRTPTHARTLVEPAWADLLAAEPELAGLVDTPEQPGGVAAATAEFLAEAGRLLDSYFGLEDPSRLEPAERELYVECLLPDGLLLRGYVDRLDEAPDGALRVVDYKTGKAPRAGFEQRAMFQMRFYAVVLWRLRGRVPRQLQLMYLGSGEVLRYEPDAAALAATQRKLSALWAAIDRAGRTGHWLPRKGPLCAWCAFRAICPEWGGTPPPLPADHPWPAADAAADEVPSARTAAVDM